MKPKKIVKHVVQSMVGITGFELRRKTERSTLAAALQHIHRLGFYPKTVIDVGAASGTVELYHTFPDARHLMVEPLFEFKDHLQRLAAQYRQAEVIIAAAAAQPGELTFNVHTDLYGSSLYREVEESDVNGIPRTVPCITLDSLLEEKQLEGPILLKVDVQGAELDVLNGAQNLLPLVEYTVLETALFQFYEGSPQMADVVAYMKERGFVVYELVDTLFRPLDGAMSQVDLAFVKENGMFRRSHAYATPQQRAIQNRRMKE